MLGAIGALITLGVAAFGYVQARVFTRRKLAFVDAAQTGVASQPRTHER